MKKTKIINLAAFFLYCILLLWVPKKITSAVFNHRKKNAVKKAVKRYENANIKKKIFVVQIEKHFIVGTRQELRQYNKAGRKVIVRTTRSHLLDFDYRNAIVYTAG